MTAPAAGVLGLVRQALRLGRGEIRGWYEWASENPLAAVGWLLGAEAWLRHRHRKISGRRFVLRGKARVLANLESLERAVCEVRGYFEDLAQRAITDRIEVQR